VLQGFMPPDAFTFDTSGQLVMQTAIGGAGTLFGPLLGAAVWLFLRDFLQAAAGLSNEDINFSVEQVDCAASSTPTAPARARSSRCSPAS
jgi:ABC-type branched-subunit amino acid transport system permease subunit